MFLHRLYKARDAGVGEAAQDWSLMERLDESSLIDISGAYILQASVDAVDGSTAELKDRASSQLLAMKDTLKQAVNLSPGDRLALSTTAPKR